MDKHNEHVSAMRNKLFHINNKIKEKQKKLEKWEKSLARKREKSLTNSSISNSKSADISTTDSDTSNSNSRDVMIIQKVEFEESPKSLPYAQSQQPTVIETSESSSQDDNVNDVVVKDIVEDGMRRSLRVKPRCDKDDKLNKKPRARRVRSLSFPPFPNNLRNIDQLFSLPEYEFSLPEDMSETNLPVHSEKENEVHNTNSPLCNECIPFHEDVATLITPNWIVSSAIKEPIEALHLWTEEHLSVLVTCQRSRISVWTKSEKCTSWNLFKSHNLRIHKDHIHRFDIVFGRDKIGVLFTTKFKTTLRISLHTCYPRYSSTEKSTTVSEHIKLILCCRCGDNNMVYAFVDDYRTNFEIWRTDSRFSRLFRGREVASIGKTIHSLCPVANTKGTFFIGVAKVNVYVWNVGLGSLIVAVNLDESFISIKSCGFANFEKGFIFLGVVSATDRVDLQVIVVNPTTAKWKCLVSWEENNDEHISVPKIEGPVAQLLATLYDRQICLRDVTSGSLVAKSTLNPLSDSYLTTAHLTYPTHTQEYALAIGNTAGTVTIYTFNSWLT